MVNSNFPTDRTLSQVPPPSTKLYSGLRNGHHNNDTTPDIESRIAPAPSSADAPLKTQSRYLFKPREWLKDLPSLEYIVDGWFARGTVGVLAGSGDSYKSLLALDMAFCIATGLPFMDLPTMHGYVAYIAAEGLYGLDPRISALERSKGMSADGRLFVLGDAPSMVRPEEARELLEGIYDTLPEMPLLIVLDTLNRHTGEGDENSTTDMKALMENAEYLARETGACVLFIHHNNKSGDMRGNVVIRDNAQTVLKAKRKNDLLFIENSKQKDAPPVPKTTFQLMRVDLKEGGSSVVLMRVGNPVEQEAVAPPLAGPKPPSKTIGNMLQTLARVFPDGLRAAEWKKACPEITKSTFYDNLKKLTPELAASDNLGVWRVVRDCPVLSDSD